jgi:DNA (cytosine-5)-methyltransferase 1
VQRIGGDADDRNDLVMAFGQIVLAQAPHAFLMENVAGLLGKRGARIFDKFCEMMEGGGYHLDTKVLNASDFGVPQSRRRVFVLGSRRDTVSPPLLLPNEADLTRSIH